MMMTIEKNVLNQAKKAAKTFGENYGIEKIAIKELRDNRYEFVIGLKKDVYATAIFYTENDYLFLQDFGCYGRSDYDFQEKLEKTQIALEFLYRLCFQLELKGFVFPSFYFEKGIYFLSRWGVKGMYVEDAPQHEDIQRVLNIDKEDYIYIADTTTPFAYEQFTVYCALRHVMKQESEAKTPTQFKDVIDYSFNGDFTYSHKAYEKGTLFLRTRNDEHVAQLEDRNIEVNEQVMVLKDNKLKFEEIVMAENVEFVLASLLEAAEHYAVEHAELNPPRQRFDRAIRRKLINSNQELIDNVYESLRTVISPLDIDEEIENEKITLMQEYGVYYIEVFNYVFVVNTIYEVQLFTLAEKEKAIEHFKELARVAYAFYLKNLFDKDNE